MDHASLRILNILLGNDENEAAVELHFPAGEITFESACTFALAGADFDPHLDGEPIATFRTHFATKGSVLRFAKRITGQRAYLGVVGGFDIGDWLGSKSTNLAVGIGGFCGRAVVAVDRLELKNDKECSHRPDIGVGNSLAMYLPAAPIVQFISGPEFNFLTPLSTDVLLSSQYEISKESNRMGYRLEGETLFSLDAVEMVSTAVDFGTIQLLPSGQMVVLMADHQTTGGYPRIGQVIRRDLRLLAQLGAGDKFSFELISVAQAETFDAAFERQLQFLKIGRQLKIGE